MQTAGQMVWESEQREVKSQFYYSLITQVILHSLSLSILICKVWMLYLTNWIILSVK